MLLENRNEEVVTRRNGIEGHVKKVTRYQGTRDRKIRGFPCYSPASDGAKKRDLWKVRL